MELVGAEVDTDINLRVCSINREKETLCSMVLNFINPGTLAKVHPKRRYTCGTRPCNTRAESRGPEHGDQDQ